MARTYKRDKNGRFAGGGGSSGKKGAATKAADKSRAAGLRAKGTTGIGGRVKAKGFGGKKAKATAGGLRTSGRASGPRNPRGTINANPKVRAASASKRKASAQKSASRAASKAGMKAKTGQQAKFAKKAERSSARAEFKKLRGEARKSNWMNMNLSGSSLGKGMGGKAGAAKRKLSNFTAKRGASRGRRR